MAPYLHVPREIAANIAMGISPIRNARLQRSRTLAPNREEQVHRVEAQFAFFSRAVGPFDGKVVSEIGPGDAIPLASLVLEAGAARYIAVDRFLGPAVKARDGVAIHRCSIEDGPTIKADIIVSYNVLEHLSDLRAAFTNMARMLNPGGLMAHRIDYGPHDAWTRCADKFQFRRFPGWLWAMMGSNRGYPNRVPHQAVLTLLAGAGFETMANITDTYAGEPLQAELVSRSKRHGKT